MWTASSTLSYNGFVVLLIICRDLPICIHSLQVVTVRPFDHHHFAIVLLQLKCQVFEVTGS